MEEFFPLISTLVSADGAYGYRKRAFVSIDATKNIGAQFDIGNINNLAIDSIDIVAATECQFANRCDRIRDCDGGQRMATLE